MFDAAIKAKSLGVSLSLKATHHHVWADPARLQQILLNLLSNAVRFTGDHGWIAIASSDVGGGGGGAIHLEVKDNGVGIDETMINRIFEPFEQSTQSRRGGGLGLGLAIARSLTALHKGTLAASSEGNGLGSSFVLTLATVAPAEPAETVPAATGATRMSQHVLLVEDHADTLAVMARLLRSLGCRVTTAGSVREAIEASDKSTFDLLISDIGLPDGSGLDVMQHFKKLQIRGIALSGFGQEEDLRRSIEAGFERHLTKPLNFKTLREILSQVN
jgi:CheY-like chemotaxis protein